MTKKSMFLGIVFSGFIGFCVLFASNKVEQATAIIYDGCYEQYIHHNMPSEIFISFMQNCMSSK